MYKIVSILIGFMLLSVVQSADAATPQTPSKRTVQWTKAERRAWYHSQERQERPYSWAKLEQIATGYDDFKRSGVDPETVSYLLSNIGRAEQNTGAQLTRVFKNKEFKDFYTELCANGSISNECQCGKGSDGCPYSTVRVGSQFPRWWFHGTPAENVFRILRNGLRDVRNHEFGCVFFSSECMESLSIYSTSSAEQLEIPGENPLTTRAKGSLYVFVGQFNPTNPSGTYDSSHRYKSYPGHHSYPNLLPGGMQSQHMLAHQDHLKDNPHIFRLAYLLEFSRIQQGARRFTFLDLDW